MPAFIEMELQSDFYFNEEIVGNILKAFWPDMDSNQSIQKLKKGNKLYLSFKGSDEDYQGISEELDRVGVKVQEGRRRTPPAHGGVNRKRYPMQGELDSLWDIYPFY